VNHVSHRKYSEAIFSPLGVMGLWILWGGASLVMKHGVDIFALVGDTKTICVAILAPFTLIALAVKYVDKHSLFWGFYEAYDNLTRFLFNSISYIRVIVIAVIHAALCMMMTTIMAMFPATALGIAMKSIIFLIGNLIIFVMEAFISFVQTLRLHYYEFFSKFYEGQGSKFSPFKVMRKYTFLTPTA
jgi:V/A-type H+-transporting ATPase subunit I